jgi:hypothetical protein
MKYYFKYEGATANVYRRSKVYGDMLVAKFCFGIDAKEYVDLKNEVQTTDTLQ